MSELKFLIGSTFYTSLLFTRGSGTISSFFIYLILLPNPLNDLSKYLILGVLISIHAFCFHFFKSKFDNHDPKQYTLDETIAMLLLNIFFPEELEWTLSFALFRVFDIWKPFGIKLIEKASCISLSVRNVADDIIAAVYSVLTLNILKYVI